MIYNELMIGDCIKIVPFHNEKHSYNKQIDNGRDLDAICDFQGHIEPIPITQEILEKNGFKSRHWNNMYFNTYDLFLNENTEQITVNLNANTIFCRKGVEYYPNQKISINGSYVHELQHALKLCGIDKEIEL